MKIMAAMGPLRNWHLVFLNHILNLQRSYFKAD